MTKNGRSKKTGSSSVFGFELNPWDQENETPEAFMKRARVEGLSFHRAQNPTDVENASVALLELERVKDELPSLPKIW